MAKRKTGKVQDLNIKAESITKEELEKLQEVVKKVDLMHMQIGRVEGQKHLMLHQLQEANQEIGNQQQALEKTYGNADIDIRDGKLTYKEENDSAE
tara:strand:+ start:130 stop:417 length:288 start_codon:yes stop_codon:yes gene_type:complete